MTVVNMAANLAVSQVHSAKTLSRVAMATKMPSTRVANTAMSPTMPEAAADATIVTPSHSLPHRPPRPSRVASQTNAAKTVLAIHTTRATTPMAMLRMPVNISSVNITSQPSVVENSHSSAVIMLREICVQCSAV